MYSHMNTLGESDTNSSISTLENEYKYPIWYNKKKHDFYRKIYRRIKELIRIHSESSAYFGKMDKYIFGPSIFITCLSSIASFLSTSELVHDNLQIVFGISVGVLASISALLQSVGSAYRYSAKEEAHRQAAEDYNKLSVKVKFEMVMPNEEHFVDQLESQILEIQHKCNYFAPQFIIDKHQSLLSNKYNNQLKEEEDIDTENTPLLDIKCLQSYCESERLKRKSKLGKLKCDIHKDKRIYDSDSDQEQDHVSNDDTFTMTIPSDNNTHTPSIIVSPEIIKDV